MVEVVRVESKAQLDERERGAAAASGGGERRGRAWSGSAGKASGPRCAARLGAAAALHPRARPARAKHKAREQHQQACLERCFAAQQLCLAALAARGQSARPTVPACRALELWCCGRHAASICARSNKTRSSPCRATHLPCLSHVSCTLCRSCLALMRPARSGGRPVCGARRQAGGRVQRSAAPASASAIPPASPRPAAQRPPPRSLSREYALSRSRRRPRQGRPVCWSSSVAGPHAVATLAGGGRQPVQEGFVDLAAAARLSLEWTLRRWPQITRSPPPAAQRSRLPLHGCCICRAAAAAEAVRT
jgi:hypothetical protein